jgi:CDP-4-dehydro-6-deoxyglucose reductase, E1
MISKKLRQLLDTEFRTRQDTAANREEGHTKIRVGFPVYDINEISAVVDTMLDLRISQGPRTKEFEQSFAAYLGMSHAVAVNSGSSANLLALAALIEMGKLRAGDEVIVPAATFATVAAPLYQLGLVPVYVDCSANNWCIDPAAIEASLSPKTALIMPVHTLGFPADMDAIMAIAESRGLPVLEDCCESHGAVWRGKKVGSFGCLSTLSFFVAHNITTGEGGMVFTNDDECEQTLRSLREFGRMTEASGRYYSDEEMVEYDARYIFTRPGYNLRMTDVIASLGVSQLAKMDGLNTKRREIAAQFTKIIERYPGRLSTHKVEDHFEPTYYGFPLLVDESADFTRREVCEWLESQGIETRAMMGGSLPQQPGFRDRKHRIPQDMPVTAAIRDRAFFIGCHGGITEDGVTHVERAFEAFFAESASRLAPGAIGSRSREGGGDV